MHYEIFLGSNSKDQTFLIDKTCKTIVDRLTGKLIYTTADILPTNEGGKGALTKKLEREIHTDTVTSKDFDFSVVITFIVNYDGNIIGERIIKDNTNKVGQQMIDIVKTFKWTPAKCDNKNIAMLYTLTTFLDPSEQ